MAAWGELGVCRKGDVLGLACRVHRDPRHVLRPKCTGLMGDAQAFGQKPIELAPEPLAPVRKVQALMRKAVSKESSAGKELEIRIVYPALARALVREPVNVLSKQKPDDKAHRDSGPASL